MDDNTNDRTDREPNWRNEAVFLKFSEIYLSRELADRDSLLQFEVYYHNSLLLLNGLASTIIMGVFNARLASASFSIDNDLLLVASATLFVFGAICAIFAGASLANSRLRFMFLWGAKLRRHLGALKNPETENLQYLINDPGALERDDYVDNISSEDRNIVLALRYSRNARILALTSSVLFSIGLLSSLYWSFSITLQAS